MQRWVFLLLALIGAADLQAQTPREFDPVKSVRVSFDRGALLLHIPENAHLKTAFLKIALKSGPGTLTLGKLPKPTGRDELGDPVWHRLVEIPVQGSGLSGQVELEVTYQPCTEGEGGLCFPPTRQILKMAAKDIPVWKAEVVPAAAAPKGVERLAVRPAPAAPPAPAPASSTDSRTGLLALVAVFLAGMLASLTPCVYPMIPITMAVIGAKGGGRMKGFLLSLCLVLGMALTYTLLGVVAARSGQAFGAFAQRPAFLIPVSLLFTAFAISLFGAFEIRLPAALQSKLQGDGPRRGFGGAFVMGLVLGPLSAPCVGPVIGTVLVNIATQGNVAGGALQLFVFALGMGVLFVAVGTFSAALPRSGAWLDRLKQAMGLVVLGFAVWNLRFLLPEWMNFGMWSAVAFVGAAVLGVFASAEGLPASIAKGAGLLALTLGILLGVRSLEAALQLTLLPRGGGMAEAPRASTWLEQDLEGALTRAQGEGKLVVVDVYADWCAQCHELDETTWPDPSVRSWLREHAIAVRINTDKIRPDLAAKLQIRSYPTVLLLDGEGKELRRLLGFEKPPKMLAFLKG